MKEHRPIAPDIEQYVFSLSSHGLAFDMNVTIVIDGEKALLIDVGYLDQATDVKEMLDKRNIEVTDVILSHYHPDHSAGISVFSDATLYCSKDYEVNYKNCSEIWDTETAYKQADKIVGSGDVISFGRHNIQVFDTPGHSICGLTTIIDDQFVHVGDLIMVDEHEIPALPLVCSDGGIHEHIHSLEWLRAYADRTFVLPHGKQITSTDAVLTAIDSREKYLKSLVEFYERWHDEAYRDEHLDGWSCKNWHKGNMKQAKKLVL